jgi:hypothetical protein
LPVPLGPPLSRTAASDPVGSTAASGMITEGDTGTASTSLLGVVPPCAPSVCATLSSAASRQRCRRSCAATHRWAAHAPNMAQLSAGTLTLPKSVAGATIQPNSAWRSAVVIVRCPSHPTRSATRGRKSAGKRSGVPMDTVTEKSRPGVTATWVSSRPSTRAVTVQGTPMRPLVLSR